MTLTIEVPEELVDEVSSWQDGQAYTLNVTQSGAGTFDLTSGEAADEGDQPEKAGPTDQAMAPDMTPGSMSDTAGTTIPTTNPAVAALARKKMMA